MHLLKQLWNDERGFVNSAELILIATLAVIGLIVGLATFRDAVVQELADTGAAVGQVNQSYSVSVLPAENANGDPNAGPVISVTGDVVSIERNFGGSVLVSGSFNNFEYQDTPDQGDGQDIDALPPGIVSIGGTSEEGDVLGL